MCESCSQFDSPPSPHILELETRPSSPEEDDDDELAERIGERGLEGFIYNGPSGDMEEPTMEVRDSILLTDIF